MAAPATIDEYLDLVRKSGVADDKRLDAHVEKLRAGGSLPREPARLAGVLVRDGLLTHFQAEQILKGKWRRFFLGKYKVLEQLGTGGMGLVYLCEHKLMRRRVAVKVLPTAKAAEPSSLERFYREARAAAALDHPNIVHAYDIDQDESLHFLVMEFVDGASLQEIVKRSGPLDPQRAAHYIRQAALGLDHAHKAGLVHRDIKPGNILVDRTGIVKLLDMGLARFFADEDDVLTRKYDESVLGTADYLAPEQALDSHTVDIRADIYGLGATFYFLLTGKPPFGEGTTTQKLIWHQTRQPRPIRGLRPEVPAGIAAVIERMMAKDPNDRYQVPAEVAAALAPWTQAAIAPPSEAEMPQLSPLASGITASETTQTTAQPTPVSGPRKSWQVATPPGLRGTGGSRADAPSPPSPQPRVVQPVPVPVPVPVPRVVPAPGDAGSVSWEEVTADAQAAQGHIDTTRQIASRPRSRVHRRTTADSNRFWRTTAIVTLVLLAVLITVGIVTGLFGRLFGGGSGSGEGRQPLKVARAGGAGTFKTIATALDVARPGDVVQLLDPDHREALRVDGRQNLEGVRIEPAEGVRVVWSPPATRDPAAPLLSISNAHGLIVKNITFDGEARVQRLIAVTGSCPGLTLEGLTLRNFRKTGVSVANCAGEPGRPVDLVALRTQGGAKGSADLPESAVSFTANPKVIPPDNDHVRLRDSQFEGAYRDGPVTFGRGFWFPRARPAGVEIVNVTPPLS